MRNLVTNSQPYVNFLAHFGSIDRNQFWLKGLHGSSLSFFIQALVSDQPNSPLLVVLPSQKEAEELIFDLASVLVNKPLLFPQWPNFVFDWISPPKKVVTDRLLCLQQLLKYSSDSPLVVVTSIHALTQQITPKSLLAQSFRRIVRGDEIKPQQIISNLLDWGYRPSDMVEIKGTFSFRGNILDLYPLISHYPIRLDFFGDEIDSIRTFDISNQRSVEMLESAQISPASEVIFTPEIVDNWRDYAQKTEALHFSPPYLNTIKEITERIEGWQNYGQSSEVLDGIEAIHSKLYTNTNYLHSYLPAESSVLLVEQNWLAHEAKQTIDRLKEVFQKKQEQDNFMVDPNEVFNTYQKTLIELKDFNLIRTATTPPTDGLAGELEILNYNFTPLDLHKGNYQENIDRLRNWTEQGFQIDIYCENEPSIKRMKRIFDDRDLPWAGIQLEVGSLGRGFVSLDQKWIVISDHELFDQPRNPVQRQPKKSKSHAGAPILSMIDLHVGDYVVHVSHGIGHYQGIQRIEVDGKYQDFLHLKYKDGDTLYVPTYQIDLVQKYIGGRDEDYKPRIDRLGGKGWQRTKAKAKASIEKMAEELLQLYAERESSSGFSFPGDSPWQQEFEALFPYQETEDQQSAIDDVKVDMERSQPMDRLICGDVGYGKTEVAMRAAFKSAAAGKQVAVLVPTTVLCLQHFTTFQKRFQDFPINIEMLSRLRTDKQSKTIKSNLEKGSIDIIVGTHSLLAKSINFHDLGLLIVDEEHRFGVKHKEKIKQLKSTVDVLTLTATPIPRTLNMSMVGMRDLSLINTPPESRLPIETYVMEYNSDIIRDSILKEISRGGQVFFVHNRVQSILSIAATVKKLVPQARCAVGHGQMPERQLEQVILDFMDHQYDVLICTTIIESGIDIPNVNTILINRADALGLAQLYQLRGRVGRDRFQAYGYLFYSVDRAITEGAQKRLRVIEEFTDLGSGFKIALRDLEIRGAGDILGQEQHGHIASVGYDLYCRMLDDAVKKLKGEKVSEDLETKINLPIEAYLPDNYVPDSRQKVSLYKKIASAKNEADFSELKTEMKDRFGSVPEPVDMLLQMSFLKWKCQQMGIDKITSTRENIRILFNPDRIEFDPSNIITLIKKDQRLGLEPPAQLTVNTEGLTGKNLLVTVQSLLDKIRGI